MIYYLMIYMGFSFLSFSFNFKYFLNSLMCLEMVLIGLILMMSQSLSFNFLIYLLVFGVCESILGLVLLVLLTLDNGHDMYSVVDYRVE